MSFWVFLYWSHVSWAPKYARVEMHPSNMVGSVWPHRAVTSPHVPVTPQIPFRVYEIYFMLLAFFARRFLMFWVAFSFSWFMWASPLFWIILHCFFEKSRIVVEKAWDWG